MGGKWWWGGSYFITQGLSNASARYAHCIALCRSSRNGLGVCVCLWSEKKLLEWKPFVRDTTIRFHYGLSFYEILDSQRERIARKVLSVHFPGSCNNFFHMEMSFPQCSDFSVSSRIYSREYRLASCPETLGSPNSAACSFNCQIYSWYKKCFLCFPLQF